MGSGLAFTHFPLSALQIVGEVSIVVLVGADHYQFEIAATETICKQILRRVYLELGGAMGSGLAFTHFPLFALQIVGEVSIVVLVGADHYQFEIAANDTICKQILRRVYLELVDENAPQIALFLLPYRRLVQDLADLVVENTLLLLPELPDLLLERG
jgi:hypothetical protein